MRKPVANKPRPRVVRSVVCVVRGAAARELVSEMGEPTVKIHSDWKVQGTRKRSCEITKQAGRKNVSR